MFLRMTFWITPDVATTARKERKMPSAASSPPPLHRAFVLERTFGPLPKKRQAALGRGLRATARAYPDSVFH